MTLADRLRDRIKRDGLITFHDWMQAALYDERDGYYRRADRIRQGRAGDYRTAPETSPLFGATFANYFAQCYSDLGSPRDWTILEMGAGRGDFAHAVLTTLRTSFPDVFAATQYLIGEIGDETRSLAQRLRDYSDRVEFRSLEQLTTPFSGIMFSNELLDAFPVHRVINSQGTLREMCVEVDDAHEFRWTPSDLDPRVAAYCQQVNLQLSEGQVFEVNLGVEDFVARAASLIDHGFLITVDYGAERSDLLKASHRFSGTLRSFHRHRMLDDVLSHPGEQDLTTTVDWTQIKEAGERNDLAVMQLERLDRFLLNEGLLAHISRLNAGHADTADALRLNVSAREMIMPNGMAAHFQVMVQQKVS